MIQNKMQSDPEFVIDANGFLSAYKGHSLDIVLPPEVNLIVDRAFSSYNGYKWVRTITIPEGVTEIRPFTFSNSHISEVRLPSTLKKIGKGAFQGCRKLRSITIPDGVTEIAEHAFKESSLEQIHLPAGLERIGRKAFFRSSVKEIHLAKTNDLEIGRQAFYECSLLEKVDLSIQGDLTINQEAFYGCTSLQKVDLSVTGIFTIGMCGFYECSCLETIDLSKTNHLVIGRQAFGWCEGLTSIIFPKNLGRIKKEAFYVCKNLKTITIPEGVTEIHDYVFRNSGLEEIFLPQSIERIGEGAFLECRNLKKVHLPEGKPFLLGPMAFSGCAGLVDENGFFIVQGRLFVFHRENAGAAVYVDLPDNVTYIEDGVFKDCGPVHITMSVDCPSWPVRDLPSWLDFSSSLVKCNGSSLSFRNADGEIVAKVVVPSLSGDKRAKKEFVVNVRSRQSHGFDFSAYDSNFIELKDIAGKARMALVRLRYPYELSEKMQEAYTAFLRDNGLCAGKIVIDDADMDMLGFLLNRKELDTETVAELIGYAQKQEKYNFVFQLMDYQNREFGIRDGLQSLELPADDPGSTEEG